MRFPLSVVLILGLPGVARALQLNARQDTPSGNFSLPLSSKTLSSQKEPAATSLIAVITTTPPAQVIIPPSVPRQGRDPQEPEGVDTPPPGPPEFSPEPTLGSVTSVGLSSLQERPADLGTTSIGVGSDTTTSFFSSSSPFLATTAETASANPTTIITATFSSVGASPPTTLLTAKATPSVGISTAREELGTTTVASESDSASLPASTTTMSGTVPTSTGTNSDENGGNGSTLTIVLSTVLSVTGVVMVALAAYLCTGNRRRRIPMLNRGITPIGDDEIATWKLNKPAEKETDRYTRRPSHSQNASISTSTRRAPSLIQYQNGGRPSLEVTSPRSFIGGKQSFDLPQVPGAVLARAPNARSGLTDEMVPGDDPFLPSPKRHPSRLHKLPPSTPSMHTRAKGSRSSSLKSSPEGGWRDGVADISPARGSGDRPRSHSRVYSSSSIPPPPRMSFSENDQWTGLSPPPSRRNDTIIGLAVG
ncbi:hypothetical protein GGS23DRAFT_410371 [Durotheca rogersii]|uniref:uncharacterized protein n=1 Tax=Durotheca rogersii TaxID=419775 RepID=UPI00221F756D|nr:uncharacterized protein GGS23DRAFT_410371 [Durotheca rogersii]KAI5865115.1 hypothetical protein GGS23DRAFT_410371 [Durotheca rogersii]